VLCCLALVCFGCTADPRKYRSGWLHPDSVSEAEGHELSACTGCACGVAPGAGSIHKDSPRALPDREGRGAPRTSDSYGSRRGNDEIMARGEWLLGGGGGKEKNKIKKKNKKKTSGNNEASEPAGGLSLNSLSLEETMGCMLLTGRDVPVALCLLHCAGCRYLCQHPPGQQVPGGRSGAPDHPCSFQGEDVCL